MINVLVVDDNSSIRTALRDLIERKEGFSFAGEAVDGVQAIEKARRIHPDLVLMDMAMPNLSGAGAASAIRQILPHTKIIVFSLYTDVVGKKLAAALGVDLIIDKADGSQGLADALDKMLLIQCTLEMPGVARKARLQILQPKTS